MRVRCIDAIGTNGELVVGEEYDAEDYPGNKDMYRMETMMGIWKVKTGYNKKRFIVVSNGTEELVEEDP